MTRTLGTFAILALLVAACGGRPAVDVDPPPPPPPPPPDPTLIRQESGTSALLQAVSAVSEDVVWVSGHEGTYARTLDGGETWHVATVPNADTLQFRDVYAVSAQAAYLLSAGPGALSRIYKTTDGGESWTLQFVADRPEAFFDCFAFWGPERGVAFSDAVDGEFIILRTSDGGAEWSRVPTSAVPDAQAGGEASFAASGTCVVTQPGGRAWIGTGAADTARVLRTSDYGRSWEVFPTPIVAGEAAGIASLAFRTARDGVIMGGDLARPEAYTDNVAVTHDGGRTWTVVGHPHFRGAIYGGVYVPGAPEPILVAVGPGGMGYSLSNGRRWVRLDTLGYWAVDFASPEAGWAVGPDGRITKIELY